MRNSILNYAENRTIPVIHSVPRIKKEFQQKSLSSTAFPTEQKTEAQYHGYSSTNTTDVLDQVHVQQQDGLSWVS